MEPLVTAALALGTVLGTKALEKTGEKIGETLFEQSKQLLTDLKYDHLSLATTIEGFPNQPVDYSEAILAIQAAATKRPELWLHIQKLAELGQNEPKLIPYIQKVEEQCNQQKSIVNKMGDNYGVIAEKIDKNVNIHTVQGDVNI